MISFLIHLEWVLRKDGKPYDPIRIAAVTEKRSPLMAGFGFLKTKKPTRQNTLRCFIASAYLLTNFPAKAELLLIQSSVIIGRPSVNSDLLDCEHDIPSKRISKPSSHSISKSVIFLIWKILTIYLCWNSNEASSTRVTLHSV